MFKKYIFYIGSILSLILPFLFLSFLFIKFEIYQDRQNTTYFGILPFIIYFFVFSFYSLNIFEKIRFNIPKKKEMFWYLTVLLGSTIAIFLDFVIFNFIKFLNINLHEIVFATIEVILFFAILTLLSYIFQNLDKFFNKYSSKLSFFKKKNDKKNKNTSSKEAQILAAEVLIKVAKENNEPEMEKVGKDFLNKNK